MGVVCIVQQSQYSHVLSKRFSLDFIFAHPDLPWDWASISNRSDLDGIDAGNFPWDFDTLSSNTFCFAEKVECARVVQETCDDWIDKPTTLDGKLGVSVRVGWNCVSDLL